MKHLTELEESLQKAGVGSKFWTTALADLGEPGKALGDYLIAAKATLKQGKGFSIVVDSKTEREGHTLFMAGFRAMVKNGVRCCITSLSRLEDIMKLNAQGAELPDELRECEHLGITDFCDDEIEIDAFMSKRSRHRIEDLIRRRLDNGKSVSITAKTANLDKWWSGWILDAFIFDNKTLSLRAK